MSYVLQIDHRNDLPTEYCQAFREKLVFRDFPTRFPTHSLVKAVNADAESGYINYLLTNTIVDYISVAGHGEYYTLSGEDGVPIWDCHPTVISSSPLTSLRGKIVHMLSCNSGSYLGHKMVELLGVECFWGYTSEFSWPYSGGRPIEDDIVAELFFEMDAIIDRGILSGDLPQKIYQDISKYVCNTVMKLGSDLHRGMFLDNFMIIVCPALSWGNPMVTLGITD